MKKRIALLLALVMAFCYIGGGYSETDVTPEEQDEWIWPEPEPAPEELQESEEDMAALGASEFRANGTDYTINDPNNANEFSASVAYSAGQYVYYQGILYRFTADHAAGAWNSAHVTQAKLGQDVSELKSALMPVIRTEKNGKSDALGIERKKNGYKYFVVNGVITEYSDANYTAYDYDIRYFEKVMLEVAATSFDYYVCFLDKDKSTTNKTSTSETIDNHVYFTPEEAVCYIRISKKNTVYANDPVVYGVGYRYVEKTKTDAISSANNYTDSLVNSYTVVLSSGQSGELLPVWEETGYKYYLVNGVVTRYSDSDFKAYDYDVSSFNQIILEVASTSFDYYALFLDKTKQTGIVVPSIVVDNHVRFILESDVYYLRITKKTSLYQNDPTVYGNGFRYANQCIQEGIKNDLVYGRIDEIETLQGYYSNSGVWNKTGLGRVTKKYYIKDSDTIEISGDFPLYGRIYTLIDANGNDVGHLDNNSDHTETLTDYEVNTVGATWLLICNNGNGFAVANGGTIVKAWHKINEKLYGKNILWLGTSIPAGGGEFSYPKRVEHETGAVVNNQAVGNSCVASKLRSRINAETNPYGFVQYFAGASRCLTNTIEEMQWIANWIDYRVNGGTYQNEGTYDANVFTVDVPTTWTQDDEDFIMSCSYENKILPLFQAPTDIPDIVVFDHGFNDWPVINTSEEDSYETDIETYGRHNMYTYRGCCNFILDLIQSYNNDVRIIMSTPYLTSGKVKTIQRNEQIAAEYGLQLVSLEKLTGWSNDFQHEYYGSWNNGVWGFSNTTVNLTPLFAAFPDHIHPHTDYSGTACRKLQNIFVSALNN